MEHFVHLYQETRFLADAVAEYLGGSLNAGAAAIVIATPVHRAAFLERLDAEKALREGRLKLLDAAQTLTRLVRDGMPQWRPFKEIVGAMISELCARHPAVRVHGEMVDLLWQQGRRDAALRLEGYWNELGKLHTCSLSAPTAWIRSTATPTAARSSRCAMRTRSLCRRGIGRASTRRCAPQP
jgi:MEDS: MEthanogen/methylotroph, DcmR Sensory domain